MGSEMCIRDRYTYNVGMIVFEWDARKAATNLRKHGIRFEEAQSVFYDEFATQFGDEDHSSDEDRFIMLGLSNRSRVLTVVHCVRDEDTIRIISARRATRPERSYYQGPTK